jgi:hypothetical protein
MKKKEEEEEEEEASSSSQRRVHMTAESAEDFLGIFLGKKARLADNHIEDPPAGLASSIASPIHDGRGNTGAGSNAEAVTPPSAHGKTAVSGSKDRAKGLREFSWRVCMKVEEKGCTSYNEVADELVHEMSHDDPSYDQKNIRRRVYDALNVLMAIGVITKDRKLIRWIGLPSGVRQEINELEREKQELVEAIGLKRRIISERLRNEVAIRRLILRNKTLDSAGQLTNRATVKLPFLLLHVHKDAIINGYVTQDG